MAGRTGIEVEGLAELRRGFDRTARKGLDKSLRAAHRVIARDVAADIKGATTGTRMQRAALRSILGKGEPTAAVVAIRNTAGVPFGMGAFMGALRYKQFSKWVGNDWSLEDGVGPYVVAPTISRDLPKVSRTFVDEVGKTLHEYGLELTHL